jgi:hypothetical protein
MSARLVAVASLMILVGCERNVEILGFGPWKVGKTERSQATGVCQPTELPDGRTGTWCFRQPAFPVAKKAAEVDLYFDGTAPQSRLIELQLKIRGCVEDEVEAWLRQHFGAPVEHKGTRAYWRSKRMFLAAFLPHEPGRCILRMLPTSETSEIERIKLL